MSEAALYLEVPTDSIIIPKLLLREAQTEDEGYLTLKGSITDNGIRSPLVVMPGTEEGTYILSDGTQRLSIAKDLGLPTVPVKVENMSESDGYVTQIEMNLARVEVNPKQYSEMLAHYAHKYPTCTVPELARKLNKSPDWLRDRLDFKKLSDNVQTAVLDSSVTMSKAILLKGLEKEVQDTWIEKAMVLDQAAFADQLGTAKKEYNKAKREGRAPAIADYVHEPKIRSKVEVLGELESLASMAYVIDGLTEPTDVYQAVLKWILRSDPKSVETGKAQWESEKAAALERAERRKAEREAKKAEVASDSRG